MGSVRLRLRLRVSRFCRSRSRRRRSLPAMALSALRSRSSSSARSGTAISAALEGVAARTSATKSAMVTSGSWPTAEITGISDS